MNARILQNIDVSYLEKDMFANGLLAVKPSAFYDTIPQDHLAIFCHKHGIYSLPTTELIDWLKSFIIENKTIEIGAGVGTIGRSLGIPTTDSCYMQKNPAVAMYYALAGQPVTKYPSDIIELDAISAVKKFKPEVVIGSWITHKFDEAHPEREGNMYGVDEKFIIDNCTYIMIGNESVHYKKPTLSLKYETYRFPWIRSRSMNFDKNIIYVWRKDRINQES